MPGPQSTVDPGVYFAALPEWILFADIPDAAKIQWCVLQVTANQTRGGECRVSQQLLADKQGCSTSSVQRYHQALEEIGALTVDRDYDPDTKQYRYSTYRLHPIQSRQPQTGEGVVTSGQGSPAGEGEVETKKGSDEERETTTSQTPSGDTSEQDNFRLTLDVQDTDTLTRQLDSLRDTYPRRQNRNGGRRWGGGSRQETEEQFRRLDVAERRQVLVAAEHYAAECEQTDTYPKHCHRWIQKGLWREYLNGPTVGTLGRDDSRLVL